MPHRVLIADDDGNTRKGLRELLELWGYEVAEASDGEAAAEQARSLTPAVVIADLRMPKLDGLGCWRRSSRSCRLRPSSC